MRKDLPNTPCAEKILRVFSTYITIRIIVHQTHHSFLVYFITDPYIGLFFQPAVTILSTRSAITNDLVRALLACFPDTAPSLVPNTGIGSSTSCHRTIRMPSKLHNTPESIATRLVQICSDWNVTQSTLQQFFGEDILQQDWFSRSLQAWCLESNALSFAEDSARFRRKRRQRQPSTTEALIRDWRPNDIDSCLNDLLTEV